MATTTVTIACKLPNGLKLELPGQKPVFLLGSRVPRDDNGMPLSDRATPGGFGLTFNVDAEFWAKWKETHTKFPPLEKGFIFAMEKAADATALAKEMKDEKTGLEGKDPNALPKGLEMLEEDRKK